MAPVPTRNAETFRIYGVAFMVAATVGIALLGYEVLRPFLAAIAWALVLAVAFHSAGTTLRRKLRGRSNLAAGMLTAAIGLLVILPAGFLVGMLANQAQQVVGTLIAKLNAAHVRSFSDFGQVPTVARILDQVKDRVGITPETFHKVTAAAVEKATALAPELSAKVALGVFDAVGTYVMTLFLLFFFLRDGSTMAAAILELVPVAPESRATLGRSLKTMLQALFRGSLLCALAQGAAGALGWWIAGLPMPLLAGAAMAVLSLLPVGGTALLWLPGSLWVWATGHRGAAIFLGLWGVLVVSFMADNILRPLLMRGAEELSPLVIILGVFGGLAAFGVLGIFIGPLTLVLGMEVLGALRAHATGAAPQDAEKETGTA